MYYEHIKIYYDGIDIPNLDIPISGYTTNPTILNKNGINISYKEFALDYLKKANGLPVSLEVLSDNQEQMIEESKILSSWGTNVYVKIPIINTKGEFNTNVIQTLVNLNIKQNITAIFTQEQIDHAFKILKKSNVNNILSIFSGRIADTGIDPEILCKYSAELTENYNIDILWASTREVYNIFQAINSNCDIITVPDSIIKKLNVIGKDLNQFSKETVEMFVNDGKSSGLEIKN